MSWCFKRHNGYVGVAAIIWAISKVLERKTSCIRFGFYVESISWVMGVIVTKLNLQSELCVQVFNQYFKILCKDRIGIFNLWSKSISMAKWRPRSCSYNLSNFKYYQLQIILTVRKKGILYIFGFYVYIWLLCKEQIMVGVIVRKHIL